MLALSLTGFTDAVEKGAGMPAARNNRIMGAGFLNRSCAFYARLESILLGEHPQNPFSTASTICAGQHHRDLAGQVADPRSS
jgi:hypothetical protein